MVLSFARLATRLFSRVAIGAIGVLGTISLIGTISLVGAIGAIAISAADVRAQARPDPVVELKVAHFLTPTTTGQTAFIEPWCAKIEAESAGSLKCRIFPAMQLGGTPQQLFTQARDGIADIVWTLPGYTPGRFPVAEIFELPFLARDHVQSSRAFWDYVQAHAQREFAGVKPIATWINGANALHLRNRPVQALADLRGLRIRAPSRLGTRTLSALGATPIGMPVPQMAEALSKGVIDGALLPWEVMPSIRAHELTSDHLEVDGATMLSTATMVFVMNERRYRGLTPAQRQVIDANSGQQTSAWAASRFSSADAAGRAAAAARGNAIRQLPAEARTDWERAVESVAADWVAEMDRQGRPGAKLLEDARDLVGRYGS